MTTETNRIEKQIKLRAPRSRVWKAITNAKEFGSWFGINLDGDFVLNRSIKGKLESKNYGPMNLEFAVVKMEAEQTFSYRWTPHPVDPKADYSKEEPTLVEFTLEEVDGGTLLKVVESGFDLLPIERRAKVFALNSEGWGIQLQRVEKYLKNAGE